MKCNNCGKQNPQGARYCGYCQHELKTEPASGINIVLLVVCALLIGLLAGILLWHHLSAGKTDYPIAATIIVEPTWRADEQTEDTTPVIESEPIDVPLKETVNYMNLISAGQYHSVAIYEDGTVGTVGRSDRDRADVSNWTDIIAISAYSHTVGLKSDGRVVASGDWDDGRCDVSRWSDIVDIDTGEKNTIGLKADGTVRVVGENEYGQRDTSHWTNIVDVAIGTRTAYGVKSNGRVVAVGGNNSGQRDIGGWSDIIAISAGPYHVVGLRSDGTVVATGANTAGQCEVESWTDIVAISAGK